MFESAFIRMHGVLLQVCVGYFFVYEMLPEWFLEHLQIYMTEILSASEKYI